jgi:hypothetical protein
VEEDSTVSTALMQKAPSLQIEDMVSSPDQSAKNRRMSRRLSARQFYENHLTINELEAQIQDTGDWEMVLINGEHEEHTEGILRQQDIVVNGHADG